MAERTRVSQVWLAILAIWVGLVTVSPGRAQEKQEKGETKAATASATSAAGAAGAKRESGIYLEAAETGGKDEPKRLDAEMPQMQAEGMGASMATMGFKRPKMISKLGGDKAALRVGPQSTFLFVFGSGGRPSRQDMMDNPMLAMGATSNLPPNTSSPKEYALIILAVADGERVFDSGKGKQIKCAVENVQPKVFRIKPEAPLPPGEYGFTYLQNGMASMVWDFGVDGPSTK
jgi:hypothetical protein